MRLPEVCSGEITIRPLRAGDRKGWSSSLRENENRMKRWWPPVDDWHKASSGRAFAAHYLEVRRTQLRKRGTMLAVCDPAGLAGEWSVFRSDLTAEVGLWFRPFRDRNGFLATAAAINDALLGDHVQRLEAPVAVGNPGPRGLLRYFGYEVQATIPQWRGVGGELADFDLYGLTRPMWIERRRALFKRLPWPQVSANLERLD